MMTALTLAMRWAFNWGCKHRGVAVTFHQCVRGPLLGQPCCMVPCFQAVPPCQEATSHLQPVRKGVGILLLLARSCLARSCLPLLLAHYPTWPLRPANAPAPTPLTTISVSCTFYF